MNYRGKLEEEEEEESRRLPKPLPISAQGVVNPTSHIMLSFPVPILAAPTPLQTGAMVTSSSSAIPSREDSSLEDGEGAAHERASASRSEKRWEAERLEALTRGVQESAAILVQTSKFTRFLQEELHRETAALGLSSSFSPSPGAMPGKLSITDAAQHLQDRVVGTITSIITTSAHRTTITCPTTLSQAKSESWTPSPSGTGMNLRPRISQPVNVPHPTPKPRVPLSNKTAMTPSGEDTSASTLASHPHCPTSPPPPHPLGFAALGAKTTGLIDASFRDAAKGAIENAESTSDDLLALQQFNQLLPHYTEPFKDVSLGKITHFLSVMSSSPATEPDEEADAVASTGTRRTKPAPRAAGKKSGETEWKVAVRGLACLTVITHSAFSTDAVPDGLLDRLVGTFGRVVRRVSQAVSRPAVEFADLSGEVSKAAAHSRTGKRSHAAVDGGVPSVIAAAGSTTSPTTLMWIELLRLYLQRLGLVLCHRGLNLVSDGELERLEDSVFQSLFLVAHRAPGREVYMTYSSYVMDAAVHAYRCLWNRLEVQRLTCAEHFFPRILLSEYLPLRTYSATGGKKLMPLTAAMLAAAQSTPIYADRVGDAQTDRLFQQCDGWARALVEQFLLRHIRKDCEKAEQDAAWLILSQVLEDLTEVLGAPEWPAADALLRSCVMKLAHVGLGGGGGNNNLRVVDGRANGAAGASVGASPPPSCDLSAVEAAPLTAHVIDAIAVVASHLFNPDATALTGPEALNRFVSEVQVNSAITQDWRASMALHGDGGGAANEEASSQEEKRRTTAATESRGKRGSIHSSRKTSSEDEADQQHQQPQASSSAEGDWEDMCAAPGNRMQCFLYYALSRNVEVHAAADVTSVWFHTRAAHVLSWRRYRRAPLPEAAMDRLVRTTAVPCAGLEVDWERLRCWGRALASLEDRSMLSPHMRSTLVSLLLSVFNGRDAHGVEMAASDVVVKKALGHLTRLCDLYPPLLRRVWPMAQRCVHDDSARVRESSVPILLSLLSGVVGASHLGRSAQRQPHSGGGGGGGGGAVPGLPTAQEEKWAGDIVSSLVHLLHDRSVTVVSRAIAALDSLLVDRQYSWLLGSGTGGAVLSVVQSNLLTLAGPTAESKHRADVTRHFLRRWAVTLIEEDTSATGPYVQLAQELATLTMLSAKEFPHEISEAHPLVVLLRNMHQSVGGSPNGDCGGPSTAGTPGLTAAATTSATSARRRGKSVVEGQQLHHAMRNAARALWARYQASSTPCTEAVCSLATLHVLALVCREWVDTLLEPLAHCLTLAQPPPTQSPRYADPSEQADYVAGVLLQACQLVRAVLASPKVPTVSLKYLSQQLNRVLSRYVGKLQSRVIVACIGALTAMITCGAKHRLSTAEVNQTYLQHCYALMNSYYVSVTSLLEGLESSQQNLPYVQRFLFLLSEFLRQYPGWKDPVLMAALAQSPLVALGQQQQNALASGIGICGNVYDLVQRVLAQCQHTDARQRIFVICLRVLSSLCMLDPTTYLYRSEPFLREALTSADTATRVQGLSLIRDFLVDEDSRVDLAARLTDRLMVGGGCGASAALLLLSSSAKRGTGTDAGRRKSRTTPARRRRREPDSTSSSEEGAREEDQTESDGGEKCGEGSTVAFTELQDQNSGMSTWLVQSFHANIVELSLCGSEQIRSLCLEVLQVAAQGGLMPPVKYLDVIAALATDGNATIHRKAAQLLAAHAERYEDAIAAQTHRAVQLIFQLHHACGTNLVESAFTKARSAFSHAECSVYAPLFLLFHKRNRENFVVTLTRFLYQDTKAVGWCRECFDTARQQQTLGVRPDSDSDSDALRSSNPVTFLAHLAVATALCPFTTEGDVVSLMHHCRTGVDLNGQSSLDCVVSLLARHGAAETPATAAPISTGGGPSELLLSLWKSVGVVLLSYMRRAVKLEYHLTAAKLQKYGASSAAGHAAPLHARQPHSPATVALLSSTTALVERASPLLLLLVSPREGEERADRGGKDVQEAIQGGLLFLRDELEAALMDDGADELLRTSSSGDARTASLLLTSQTSSRRSRRAGGGGAPSTPATRKRGPPGKTTGGRPYRHGGRRKPRVEDKEDTSSEEEEGAEETPSSSLSSDANAVTSDDGTASDSTDASRATTGDDEEEGV